MSKEQPEAQGDAMKEDEKKEENKQEAVGLLEGVLLFLEAYIKFPRYRP